MTNDEGGQKKRLKKKQKFEVELNFSIEETFDPSNAKDKDFDLNIKDMMYQAKKGQAGSRTKSVGGDGGSESDSGYSYPL